MMSAFFYLQAALNRLFNSCQKQSSGGVLCGKGVIRNFAKFLGEHLCQSLFIKKETLAQVLFSCEFCEISKNTFFLQKTSGGCF